MPPQEVITKQQRHRARQRGAALPRARPNKAVTEIENFLLATSELSQNATLRSVLGKASSLTRRSPNAKRPYLYLQQIIDEQTGARARKNS